ncbi:MAG: hypothetical protein IIU00_09050 [Clostridia bacterium]|nr:hypothetical protein [Clostridia bacterium]
MKILTALLALAAVFALLLRLSEKRFLSPLLDRLLFHEAFTPSEEAVLVEKIAETAVGADGIPYDNLLLRFETSRGEVRCYVTGRVYRQVCEGMEGTLTHRGSLFKCFDVGSVRIGR